MEEKLVQSGKEKPRYLGAEKNVVSQTGKTKDELIVGIPMIARLRPVVVEPDPVRIAFQIEDVRIAIGVGMYGAPSKSLPAQFVYTGCTEQKAVG